MVAVRHSANYQLLNKDIHYTAKVKIFKKHELFSRALIVRLSTLDVCITGTPTPFLILVPCSNMVMYRTIIAVIQS